MPTAVHRPAGTLPSSHDDAENFNSQPERTRTHRINSDRKLETSTVLPVLLVELLSCVYFIMILIY